MVTKKERVDAIAQLEQFADTWISGPDWDNHIAHGDTALCSVAYRAQDAVTDSRVFNCQDIGDSISMAHIYLEAAALLRDGWEPGEPLERLR